MHINVTKGNRMAHRDQFGGTLGGRNSGKTCDLQRVPLRIARQGLEHTVREHNEGRSLSLPPCWRFGGNISHSSLAATIVMRQLGAVGHLLLQLSQYFFRVALRLDLWEDVRDAAFRIN